MEFELLSAEVLTADYYEAFQAARRQRMQRLERYQLPRNTQTYDNIYFRERVQTWNSRLVYQLPTEGHRDAFAVVRNGNGPGGLSRAATHAVL